VSLKKVLVVDDDLEFVKVVKTVLEQVGYEVDVAYDGKAGLEKVAQQKPDVIILDVMMPVMNGYEACKALKVDPATKDIPIILLTAVAAHITSSNYTPRDMLESNADDYLPKPVEPEELLQRLKNWV
jgi:CheY-like chemotaxis protein